MEACTNSDIWRQKFRDRAYYTACLTLYGILVPIGNIEYQLKLICAIRYNANISNNKSVKTVAYIDIWPIYFFSNKEAVLFCVGLIFIFSQFVVV